MTLYLPEFLSYFASTDCVYGENDARHPRFTEDDALCPVNVYGAQKAEAEEIVRAHGFTVLRFPFHFFYYRL